jgi:hypothetical protein
MFKRLKDRLARRALTNKQRATAVELQAVYDAQKALAYRAEYLVRLSANLSAQENALNIAAFRAPGVTA